MLRTLAIALCLACWLPVTVNASNLVKIGVLAKRGAEATHIKWDATAEYLSDTIQDHQFEIVPLGFDEIKPAVANRAIDYILTNPSMYVDLEMNFDASRIATLRNNINGSDTSSFGGVVFTRASHPEIKRLEDISGHVYMGVHENSLGGFQAAWCELVERGIQPYRDFSEIRFGGTHDAVVLAVRDGAVDAGTVRTDTLESMVKEGIIQLSEFRILNRKYDPGYPFVISTPRYPEWPFAALAHTSAQLTNQVAAALLAMPPESPAAVAGKNLGWTVPQNYRPVHELLQKLEIGPYSHLREINFRSILKGYLPWVLGMLITFILLCLAVAYSIVVNRHLRQSRNELVDAQQSLEQRIHERTEELNKAIGDIQRSRDENEALLNSTLDGIYGMDSTGHTIFINKAAQDMLGYSLEDFQNHDTHALIHHSHIDGSHFPKEECPIGISVREGKPQFIDDEVFWAKDGTAIPVEYTSAPIFKNGELTGVVVSFRNISERLLQQDAVNRFRSAMNASSDAIYLIDYESMRFIDMNDQACQATGYSREELLGMGPQDINPDYNRAKVMETWSQLFEDAPAKLELLTLHQRKDGATFPVEVHIDCMIEHTGRKIIVSTVRDISKRLETEKTLRDSEARWRSLAESSSDYIATITPELKLDYINHNPPMMTAEQAVGQPIEEFIYPEEQRTQVMERLRRALETGQPTGFETYLPSPDGKPLSFEVKVTTRSVNNEITGLTLYARDITERKSIEETLRLASVAMESSEAMIITNARSEILKVNHAFQRMTGYAQAEAIGKNPSILNSGRHSRAFFEGIERTVEKDGSWEGEIWNRRKDGDVFPCWVTITAIKDEYDHVTHYVGNYIDITDQKTSEMRIMYQAFYDALTDLPNRRLLMDRLQQTIARCIRHQHTGALLFLDLDGFKPINDAHGHQVGDELLIQFAKRLKLSLRDEDTAARLGGDEFIILLPELQQDRDSSLRQAIEVAEKILELCRKPFLIGELELPITTSVGITLFPGTTTKIDDIINQADIAMYEAKRIGKNTYSVYDQD